MASIGTHRKSLGVPRMKSGGLDTTVQGEKPLTTLNLWIIRFQSGGIVVEGYKTVSKNDSTTLLNWRSTPIESRIDSKTLVTHSGSVYKLKGSIDEDEAAEAGIPSELIEEFTEGFPENWKELIQDQLQQKEAIRRESTMNKMDVEEGREEKEDEERLKEAKKRRSLQKGRKSLMQRVQPGTPIEEEEEEREETPGRRKTPARRNGTSETPGRRNEERKTPRGRGREATKNDEEEEEAKIGASRSTPKTMNREKRTPRGRKKTVDEEEDEIFATPDEIPLRRESKSLALAMPPERNDGRHRQRRVSLEDIPAEVMSKTVKLSRWVIRFVRGGTDTSIFPHFQFKVCGFRPESDENEWCTSAIQKVVPPHLMFTNSSIYLLDGRMDIDQSAAMGFPPRFISDFVLGFPDDWHVKLGTFYDRVFGPQPVPTLKIVELTSDGGTADEGREEETRKKEKDENATPRTKDEQKYRASGLNFEFDNEMPGSSRKRKEPTPSSSSSSDDDESTSEDEEQLRREAIRVEKEERRREEKARREAEKAKTKEEKKKRFEVTVNTTPDGIRVSRSGRTLRTPLATWAGESITYDVRGNVVEMKGVTTTTRLTVGKTNNKETELLAAHYGVESHLNEPIQKERAIAPPSACRPKTPVPKKSKADYRGFSDDETDQIPYNEYLLQKRREAEATPAFNLKKGKKRCNLIESSDSEAEEAERKREEKRRKREERRRLRESEEEEESSDAGWRRKKRPKKKVIVKKEKQTKRAPSKKRRTKKEEERSESDLEIEHNEDAVTFVPSENGSNDGGNGYSDDELMRLEEERDRDEEAAKKVEKTKKKKQPVKRAKEWKKEELIRLKLAITAQSPDEHGLTREGWEKVAKSVGGERTVEMCKKAALERLKMKVDEIRSDPESGEASEDEDKMNRRNAKLNDENRPNGVTAKKGTIQYAVEMENKKRELMMGGSASQEDYFKDKIEELAEQEPLPSVETFDPNDSLLSALDDSSSPAPKQRMTKTARAAAAPATPALSSFNGSITDSAERSSRRSARFFHSPAINQNDLTRYVHHLSRTKAANFSMLSKSMADRSKMMPPKVPKGNTVAREAEKIEKAQKQLRNRGRRRNEMDDLNEDEENEEGNVLDGLL